MKKLLVLLVILGIGAGIVLYKPEPTFTPPQAPKVTYNQDPTLLNYAHQLGIDVSKLNLVYTNDFSNVTLIDKTLTRGSFSQPNTIYVKPGTGDEMRVLAHEYMHYVWYNMSLEQNKSASSMIRPVFSKFSYMLKNYPQDQDTLDNESNSYICTSISPYQLSVEINNYCNSYISNRNLLF